MNHLSIDIETYSSVDIKKAGLYKYAQSPDFQIMLLAYAWKNDPVQIIDFMTGYNNHQLQLLLEALQDPRVTKKAFNAAFEWYCHNVAGYQAPLEQWQCTMANGLYCGYSGGLAAMGEAVGIPTDKKKLGTGAALIRTFCVPQKPTKANGGRTRTLPQHEPEKWELFKTYCMQDVEAERALGRCFAPWPMPEREQRLWQLDCRMNAAGVKVNPQLVEGALACASQVEHRLLGEAMAISGLDNPKSRDQLLAWLQEELEDEIPDITEELQDVKKDTVADLLARGVASEAATRMLEIRQQIGKTSTRKYDAMTVAMGTDSRVRGLMQYYGASRTGRYAGRLVQIQNLPRNYLKTLKFARELVCQRREDAVQLMYGNIPDTLSQLIRTAFVPETGCFYLVADYSAIEARVTAWLAGEQWRLDVFAGSGKIYEASAEQMFHLEPGSVKKGDPMRQRGKVAELALGYGGSKGALIAMGALREGLTEEELPDIVTRWRAASPCIVRLWKDLESAALVAVESCEPRQAHGLLFAREWDPNTGMDNLTITLPAGRKLLYPRPFISENRFGRPALHYYGVGQKNKKWGVQNTFGGKITENVVQAIARDCLADLLLKLDALGYMTVFHVHDEVIIEHLSDDLEAVLTIMADPVPWAPGLILKGDGFTTAEFYRKE